MSGYPPPPPPPGQFGPPGGFQPPPPQPGQGPVRRVVRLVHRDHGGKRAGGRQGDEAVLSVADNGPGIPEADLERVRERFVRLDESRNKPGSGLGLSLVDAVMRLHGGSLKLASNHPGLLAKLVIPLSSAVDE